MSTESLILHPTDTAQWHAIVNEAQAHRSLELGVELESYLVFLLMRFVTQPQLASSVLALDLLEGVNTIGKYRHDRLKDVGDKCLLYSGLFPGRASRRQVKPSYFVSIGKTAYGTLSSVEEVGVAELFKELCSSFVPLMDVLQAMRELSGERSLLLPLEAMELWQDTGSKAAKDAFEKVTLAIPSEYLEKSKNKN